MKEFFKKINLHNIAFLLIILVLFFMPFSAFILTWLKYSFKLSESTFFIISLWKEYILSFLFFIIVIDLFKNKKSSFKLLKIDKIVLSFFLIVFLYFLLFNLPFYQKIIGLRYDIEFLLFYFATRLLFFDLKKLKIITYTFLVSSSIVLFFGLLQISFLPPEFMLNFGYSRSIEEYVKTGVISTYTALDPSLPNLYRIQSFFSGALQFSSYLIIFFSFCFVFAFLFKKYKRYIFVFLLFLSFIALYSTHTRSAWIAIIILFLSSLFFLIKDKKILLIFLMSLLTFFLAGIFVFFNNDDVQTIILHGEFREGELFGSTQAHFDSLIDSADLFIKNPLGNGIGYSGPASKINQKPVFTENGYLQVGLELGFLGLIIFILVITGFLASLKEIYINNKEHFQKYLSMGLFLALLGVAINNIFLHTFTDTATSYTLFIFIGMLISLNQKQLS